MLSLNKSVNNLHFIISKSRFYGNNRIFSKESTYLFGRPNQSKKNAIRVMHFKPPEHRQMNVELSKNNVPFLSSLLVKNM